MRRHDDRTCRVGAFVERILVPTDFSDAARAALTFAAALVEQCGASLHVLHVLESIVGAPPFDVRDGARSELERAVERSAWEELQHLLPDEDQIRLRVRLALEWGVPDVEIIRYVATHHVDLIAVGRDGRGGVKRLLMGSTAASIVRNAPCAVLSVTRPATHATWQRRSA